MRMSESRAERKTASSSPVSTPPPVSGWETTTADSYFLFLHWSSFAEESCTRRLLLHLKRQGSVRTMLNLCSAVLFVSEEQQLKLWFGRWKGEELPLLFQLFHRPAPTHDPTQLQPLLAIPMRLRLPFWKQVFIICCCPSLTPLGTPIE